MLVYARQFEDLQDKWERISTAMEKIRKLVVFIPINVSNRVHVQFVWFMNDRQFEDLKDKCEKISTAMEKIRKLVVFYYASSGFIFINVFFL